MTDDLYVEPVFRLAGDQGLIMEFGEGISPLIHQRIKAMLFALDQEKLAGVIEFLPAYRSITLIYDPLVCSFRQLQERLGDLYKNVGEITLPEPKIVELPTSYTLRSTERISGFGSSGYLAQSAEPARGSHQA